MASTASKLGAAAIAIAIVVVAWRVLGAGPPAGPSSGPAITPVFVDEEHRSAHSKPRELLSDTSSEDAQTQNRESGAAVETPPNVPAAEPANAQHKPEFFSFLGRFVKPDHGDLLVESAVVVLTGSRGLVREVAVAHASEVLVSDLRADVYVARVTTPGFEHRDQILDLSQPERASGRSSTSLGVAFEERLVLWPEDWIAVVVLTPDGRSFEELADELRLERKRLLVDAFEVRTRFDPPDEEAWGPKVAPRAAVWRRPPVDQTWALPGACVGSLQVLEHPPFWVGLAVHDVSLGWAVVNPGEREVVFRLDARALEDRLASLRLRVLDAPGGAPRRDARVTLKADTSAHRRDDQSNVQPKEDGRVALGRIVPGRYELSIEGDGALHQDLLQIEPGESRDLGDIVLSANLAVSVHAVDAKGKPAIGWVEIAPYRRGERVSKLYPPNLHRSLDRNGEFPLPMPTETSIVRVTLQDPETRSQTNRCSRSVLLDPQRLPTGKLELVVDEPVLVHFDLPPGDARVEVIDELGLVVATPPPGEEEERAPRAELQPGRYVARRVGPGGELLGDTTFEAVDRSFRVEML